MRRRPAGERAVGARLRAPRYDTAGRARYGTRAPALTGWRRSSEAGERPALSRNGDAPAGGMSPDACPVPARPVLGGRAVRWMPSLARAAGAHRPPRPAEMRTMNEPELLSRREDGTELAMALWRFGSPLLALSSAPYGGGWGERHWVLAAQVAGGYSRSDPAGHLAELARGLDLAGPGIGMLTAVDVRQVSTCREDRVAPGN